MDSDKESPVILIIFLLYMKGCISLAAFKMFLSLIFSSLILMCFGIDFFGIHLVS